ncbi:hypothetical protein BKA81DRAFT_371855 [Phyllosticta paracitricarpa]
MSGRHLFPHLLLLLLPVRNNSGGDTSSSSSSPSSSPSSPPRSAARSVGVCDGIGEFSSRCARSSCLEMAGLGAMVVVVASLVRCCRTVEKCV